MNEFNFSLKARACLSRCYDLLFRLVDEKKSIITDPKFCEGDETVTTSENGKSTGVNADNAEVQGKQINQQYMRAEQ